MSVMRRIWLLACVALLGCASSEGGVTGTGVTAISGNIVQVSDQAPEAAALPFPIRISIVEAPGISTTTEDGTFELSGSFSGSLTLNFANAIDGTEIGPLPLEIPAGSQTVLENIEIRLDAPVVDRVRPQAVRQFDVFGRVDMVECNDEGGGVLLIGVDGKARLQVLATLTTDTQIVNRRGATLACADIARGADVRVEGFVRRDDQTLIALVVVVAPPRLSGPGPAPRPEQLRGTVAAVACERGLISIDQRADRDSVRRIVRLGESTEFLCDDPLVDPCDCSAIRVGAPIGVAGVIFPERPGQISAELVVVGAASVPAVIVGPIVRLACAQGGLVVRDETSGQGARVAITPATAIRCRRDLACSCGDLRVRIRVRVEGVRPLGGGPLTADRIAVLARQAPSN